ncbi:class I SAM-dependent methyltransferase [Angustibacter aerolatus]
MLRHDLLRQLHRALRPRTYLEVGVNDGRSLSLSRARSVAIDPAFKVTVDLRADLHLVRSTSDEVFTTPGALSHLRGRPVDLGFVDGLHLAEFALRDFMHLERLTTPGSVVVVDDVLPRDVPEAARDRHTLAWTGDVYKVVDVLRRYRPDLVVLEVDTGPTGTAVVLCPDAGSQVLHEAYDEIVEQLVTPDPQVVPASVLGRTHAVDPARLLASPAWSALRLLRAHRRPDPGRVREAVADLVELDRQARDVQAVR